MTETERALHARIHTLEAQVLSMEAKIEQSRAEVLRAWRAGLDDAMDAVKFVLSDTVASSDIERLLSFIERLKRDVPPQR